MSLQRKMSGPRSLGMSGALQILAIVATYELNSGYSCWQRVRAMPLSGRGGILCRLRWTRSRAAPCVSIV